MDATAFNADDTISGFQMTTGNDLVERNCADGGSRQIKTADDVFQLRGFTAGNRNACLRRSFSQPSRNRIKDLRFDTLDRNVINQ